jgi:hypothetical protein
MNLKDKTILCIDNGMYVGLCRTMSRYFGKVLYYSEYKLPFPSMPKFMIGYGYPEMERVVDLFAAVDQADIIFTPDVYNGDCAQYIAENGKRVFGSVRGEELEIYRSKMKEHMKALGLPVSPYKEIKGLDALIEYLKKNKEKYVKCDMFRWDFETFHHTNWQCSEPFFDKLSHDLGPAKHLYTFIVEDAIDGDDVVETGSDFINVNGKFSDYISFGYEVKCEMYAMQFKKSSEIPKIITDFNNAIAPTMEQYQYRSMGCTEIRVGKDKVPYMIDFTSRFGSPPCEIWQEAITNWGDIIWYGSEGILIQPEVKYKYGVQFFITSEWAIHNWQSVYFPPELDQWVKLRNSCRINGQNYVVPTDCSLIGNVSAVGNDLDECIKTAIERAEQIEGYEVCVPTSAADKMREVIKKGEKLGIKFDGYK